MNIIETNFSFGSLSKRKSTTRIILHHTATSSETVEQIHNYHKNTKGWAGIGYHLYVRKDGSVYRGRPIDTVGAHASGSNSDSVGICFEGNFDNETMGDAQKQAGKEVIAYVKGLYGISKVQRHKDVCSTSCPGANFPFDELVNGAASTGTSTPAATPSPAPAPAPSNKLVLTVDGKWGTNTTLRLQQIFGTTQDGKVSHQYSCYRAQNPGLNYGSFVWENKPNGSSPLIKAIQQKVGVTADGHIGPKTIKGIQAWMGSGSDGKFDKVSPCIKKLQEWCNAQG